MCDRILYEFCTLFSIIINLTMGTGFIKKIRYLCQLSYWPIWNWFFNPDDLTLLINIKLFERNQLAWPGSWWSRKDYIEGPRSLIPTSFTFLSKWFFPTIWLMFFSQHPVAKSTQRFGKLFSSWICEQSLKLFVYLKIMNLVLNFSRPEKFNYDNFKSF